NPTNPDHLRQFETQNNLEAYSIVSMAWCCPIEKRAANQAFAMATAIVTCPRIGNRLLQESIYVGEKHISIRKDECHPMLCNKCQQYGHIRRDSPNETRCTICAGPHNTSSCTS
ncbi:hypothetical protein FIBSPDRAFT_759750, partial [Athelia psychrophila]